MHSKSSVATVLAMAAALAPGFGQAGTVSKKRDIVIDAPLSVLEKPANLDRIGRDVTIRFASEPGAVPREGRLRGNRKVFNTGNVQRDCEAALVKTLSAMADDARERGVSSIVNIRSFWDKFPTSSSWTYKCARGPTVTAVSLLGTLEGSR